MQPKELARINELARKAKAEGLTPEETLEQKRLREAYIQAYRNSMRATLQNIVVVDADGNKTPLSKKQK